MTVESPGRCSTRPRASPHTGVRGFCRDSSASAGFEAAGPPLTAYPGSTDATTSGSGTAGEWRGGTRSPRPAPVGSDRRGARTAGFRCSGSPGRRAGTSSFTSPAASACWMMLRRPYNVHQLVPGGHDRLLDGVLDALGDERERGLAPHDHVTITAGLPLVGTT